MVDNCEVPQLPPDFGMADAEANDFFVLWDNGADDNTIVRFAHRMTPLAHAIVEERFKWRDVMAAERSKDCRAAQTA